MKLFCDEVNATKCLATKWTCDEVIVRRSVLAPNKSYFDRKKIVKIFLKQVKLKLKIEHRWNSQNKNQCSSYLSTKQQVIHVLKCSFVYIEKCLTAVSSSFREGVPPFTWKFFMDDPLDWWLHSLNTSKWLLVSIDEKSVSLSLIV